MKEESIWIASFSEQLIREKVIMEKPKYFDSGANDYMYPDERSKVSHENYEYNDHVASRRTFPYPVKEEQDGKEIPESEFRIEKKLKAVEKEYPNGRKYFTADYIEVAIPIEPEKPEQNYTVEKKLKELLRNYNAMEHTLSEYGKGALHMLKTLEKHLLIEPDTPLQDKDKDSIVEELLKPRYKCIADYPESDYKVGDILPYKNDILYKHECLFFDKYPHLFKPLASLKPGDSKEKDAKGWLKKEGYPDVMPMTLDNLAIILDRYTKYLSSPPEPSSKNGYNELKRLVVENLLNVSDIDSPYLHISNNSYTRRELAKEINNQSKIGMGAMENLIMLTIDMVSRGIKSLSEPSSKEQEWVSMEEYNHAIEEIGQLQEQLKEANEYIRDLQHQLQSGHSPF